MEDLIDPEYYDNIPPAAQRYMAVWLTLAIVLLPIIVWWLL